MPTSGEAVTNALRDPSYVYTVVAITYEKSDAQLELAHATYFHFEELGLPVAYPLTDSGRIYVLVGVGKTQAELYDVQERVRTARDPDGRPTEYAGAYIVRIENVLPR